MVILVLTVVVNVVLASGGQNYMGAIFQASSCCLVACGSARTVSAGHPIVPNVVGGEWKPPNQYTQGLLSLSL